MSRLFSPARVAATFGVRLSPRYERFLAREEWKALDGMWAALPSYARSVKLRFRGAELESFFTDGGGDYDHPAVGEVELGGESGWVALATIGEEESQFLVVRAVEDPCAVAMWEHETGQFVPCTPSLDEFIAALAKTARATPKRTQKALDLAAVQKLADTLHSLAGKPASATRNAKLENGLAKLNAALPALPHSSSLDPDDRTIPGAAHYAKGVVLRALGRYDEAVTALERAVIDGVERNVAPQTVCDILLYDLDAPARVVALATSPDAAPLARRTSMLALLRLGRFEDAARHVTPIIERQVEATLRLSPATSRAAETARRRALLVEAVRAYVATHPVDGVDAFLDRVLAVHVT